MSYWPDALLGLKELRQTDPEGSREVFEISERWIALGKFDTRKVNPVDVSFLGETFL